MKFRTTVDIPTPPFLINPLERMLFVGSCFADGIGQKFAEEHFRATVNPYGTMYNPASVLHTVERFCEENKDEFPRVVFFTLGTNHVYRLNATGEIVDNCQKRPQKLFTEEILSIDEIVDYLRKAIEKLRFHRSDVKIALTVSPIRYAKYGFHESQLSKAMLLLAVDRLVKDYSDVVYFPAYEIVLDELRDYRFYKEDMLHPSAQAVEFIWEQLVANYLSPAAQTFLKEWRPIKEAFAHRPFHPESEDYKRFIADAKEKEKDLLANYGF